MARKLGFSRRMLMLARYGGFIYRFKWWFIIISAVGLVAGSAYAKGIYGSLSQGGFNVPDSQSTVADKLINTYLGGNRTSLVILISSNRLTVNEPTFKTAASQALAWVASQKGVKSLASYYTTGSSQFVSADQHSTYALAGLAGPSDQQASQASWISRHLPPSPLKIQLGGDAEVNAEATQYSQADLSRAEHYIFPVSAIILIVVFGGLVAAGLPLVMGLYGVVGALVITRLTTHATDISTYVINLISLLGMGLAIDYSLFIVSRFREELKGRQGNVAEALSDTMRTAGRTVIFSALTVLVALLGLVIFPVNYLRSMGVGGAAAVFEAVLGAITLLPALLAVLGSKINSLSMVTILGWRPKLETSGPGNWSQLTNRVLRYPVATVIIALAILLVAGLPFLSIRFINPSYTVLPAGSQAKAVGQALVRDFPANTQAPIQVVVKTLNGAPVSAANLGRIQAYARALGNLPNVSSIQNPLQTVPASSAQLAKSLAIIQSDPKQRVQLQQFMNGNYALINVIPAVDSNDTSAQTLVKLIRQVSPGPGLRRWVGGQTAGLVDLLASIKHDGVYALIVVLGGMFVLFFLMLGSIVIPLKTMILNILSLSAAFGSLVWIFQQGHLASWFGTSAVGGVDATQPVLIFALAFGLSMDYAVFLFSRVKEHFDKVGDIKLAISWGVQKTGTIITSAALLLLVVIGSFATGSIVVMKEVVVGLVVAVTVDVVIVRLLLVPASMNLLGRYNWWAPPFLKRLHNRVGLKEAGG